MRSFFFFSSRRRHTRWPRDWSSDVCSSDLLGVLISFLVIRVESALDIWWNLAGIFSGGMLGLFLLGYFSQRVTNLPVLIGVAIGLLVIMWMSLSPTYFTGAL